MKRKDFVLAIVAVILVLGMSIGTAWAYFTDTTTVEGSISIKVKPETTLLEDNAPGSKSIRITNTSEAASVWVRARAYASADLGADASGTNWSGSIADWYVYDEPLAAGAQTEPLKLTFTLVSPSASPAGVQNGDEQNIIVVYESVPVRYDASGNPLPAEWND